jgi:DNA-binding NarL/FixJ family response regulator
VARGETRAVLYAADRSSTGVGNTARAAAAEAAAALAREFEVRDEVERRLQVVRDHPAPTDADLVERVRLAHAELRALARTVPDAALRERLAAVDALLGGTAPAPAVRLSPRELDVLSLVALGCSYREVGERLFLGAQSVKTYMRNVLAKLDAHSRYEAVVVARRLQLIP